MTTPLRPTTFPSEQGFRAAAQPGWLGLRELELAGSAAERLALLLQEGSLLGRHVSLLCARRPTVGPTGAVTARGWACLGPEGLHSLRPRAFWLAGGSGLALASHHLSPWRGAPAAADGALLAGLSRRWPRPAPIDVLVAPAALGRRHTLLVVIDDGDLALPRRDVAPFFALVHACAASWGSGQRQVAPVSWAEVGAAAKLAAHWAAGRSPAADGAKNLRDVGP